MKKMFKLQNALCLLAVGMLAAACSIDQHFEIPLPGEGEMPGASAYDLWLMELAAGRVTDACDRTPWDPNKNTMTDFFDFLRGCDGKDGDVPTVGPNGNWWIDGEDTGIPARGMSGQDGRDGKSAYELWLEDLAEGEVFDHCDGNRPWDPNYKSLAAFWEWLTGCDGEGGTPSVPVIVPGAPGEESERVEGVPNVIALFNDAQHSEYVNPLDGSVIFQVYLANGDPAPAGTVVTGMPGIEAESFTLTGADGKFTVPKDKLPTEGTVADRFGTATVDGTRSAPNTYVPQKVDVRLMIGRNNLATPVPVPHLGGESGNELNGGVYMDVPVRAERRLTADGEWEEIPIWIADVDRSVRAYAVNPDTAVPDMNTMLKHKTDDPHSLKGATIGVRRPTAQSEWLDDGLQTDRYNLLTDDTPQAFTMVLDDPAGFYGENPGARAVIMTAPVNFHPLPTELHMGPFNPLAGDNGSLMWTSASFNTDNVNEDYLFSGTYTTSQKTPTGGGDPFTVYAPVKTAPGTTKCLAVAFSLDGVQTGNPNQCSITAPSYTMNNSPVMVGAYVYLRTSSLLVAGPGATTAIGRLVKTSVDPDPLQFVIRAESPFAFADIPITFTP
ncbi:MAG: hypothetical protein LBU97_03760 [Alistipes sp.]|jgi:hypothetical protein|nr:hypothetical protein [Alistipes sp.]